jgi:hypothetical protein
MLIEIQTQGKVRSGGALFVEGRSAYFSSLISVKKKVTAER